MLKSPVSNMTLNLKMNLSRLMGGTVLMVFFSGSLAAQDPKTTRGLDPRLAYSHVQQLVSFGPRPSGSPGSARAQQYLIGQLQKYKIKIEQQDFLASTPNGAISMKNIVAIIPGRLDQIVILGGHYDTKWMPNVNFVGANDGGSSAGLLLEIARVLAQDKRGCTVWAVFFDGEEAIRQWSSSDSLYGSRYFVNSLKSRNLVGKIKAMALLDMIGDKDLVLEKDVSSTGWLMDRVFQSARELGYSKHLAAYSKAIEDDHLPFIEAEIPAVDLIDLDYGFNNLYWHTDNDTLDKISPQSLKIAGDILLRTLDKICGD
jgi:glutaminyl-peptide cyclotransferase